MSEIPRRCFIGVPVFQGVDYEPFQHYFAWAYHLGKRIPDIQFLLRVIGKKEQFRARNNLCDMAMAFCNGEKDLLLLLDDDMVLPQGPWFENMIRELDARPDAGVMGAYYWQKGGSYRPVIQKLVQERDGYGTIWYLPHEITGGVMEVGVTGGGCLLFPMKAIRSLMKPIFWVDGILGTDVHICVRLLQEGWKIYCHTGVELGHWSDGEVINHKKIPKSVMDYCNYGKYLEEEACKYLQMSKDEFEGYQGYSVMKIEQNWAAKNPQTWDEIHDVYASIGNGAIARNAYYGIHIGGGIQQFSDIMDTINMGLFDRLKSLPVLDYGCGVGIASEIFADKGFQVDAYDIDRSTVLDFLEYRIKKKNLYGFITVNRMIEEYPTDLFPQYGIVILLDILEHLREPHKLLRDVLTRLVPGGYLITNFDVYTFKGAEEGVYQHLKLINIDEYRSICNEFGMVNIGTFLSRKKED